MKNLIAFYFIYMLIGCERSDPNDYSENEDCLEYENSISNSKIYYDFADSLVQRLTIICQAQIVFRNFNDSMARVDGLNQFTEKQQFIPNFINNTIDGTVIRMLEGKTSFEFSNQLGAKWSDELDEVYRKIEDIGYGEFVNEDYEYFNFYDHKDCYNLYQMHRLKNELISIQLKFIGDRYHQIEIKPEILFQSDPDTLNSFSIIPEKGTQYKES